MLRSAIVKTSRGVPFRRLLSTTPRAMAGGDVGSGYSRSGGERAGDAWTKREKSSEDYFIQREERAKLQQIRERLRAQQQHIEELDKYIADLIKEQDGTEGQQ